VSPQDKLLSFREKIEMSFDELVPRSPKETLAGFAHIPRMLDKARAYKKESLGEYIYPCPIDKEVLTFLGLNGDEFAEKAEDADDDLFGKWLNEFMKNHEIDEMKRLNRGILRRKVGLLKCLKYYLALPRKIKFSELKIPTWADYVDWEEGRF
jgi:hypothetical protein